jgi:hypothetical protein
MRWRERGQWRRRAARDLLPAGRGEIAHTPKIIKLKLKICLKSNFSEKTGGPRRRRRRSSSSRRRSRRRRRRRRRR